MKASSCSERTGTSKRSILRSNVLVAGKPGASNNSTGNRSQYSIGSCILSLSGSSSSTNAVRDTTCLRILTIDREQAEEQVEAQVEVEDKSNPEQEEPAREIPSQNEELPIIPDGKFELMYWAMGPEE